MKTTIFISLIITMFLSAVFALPNAKNNNGNKTNQGTILGAFGIRQKRDFSDWFTPFAMFTLSLVGVLLVYFF